MSHSQQNLQGNGKVWPTRRKKKRLTEIIPKEPQHTKNKDFNSLKYALGKNHGIKKKKTKDIRKIYERVGNISRTIIKRKHEKVQ